MAELYIIWDVIFSADAMLKTSVAKVIAKQMDELIPSECVEEVLVWNIVMKGQKSRRTGTSNGLRYLIPIDEMDIEAIVNLTEICKSYNSQLSSKSSISYGEVPMIPLERKRKQSFPHFGKIALQTKFTHGEGLTDSVSIQTARRQTPKTKDGLNPLGGGNKIGNKNFSDEFQSIFSQDHWFLIRPTLTVNGKVPPSEALSQKADGGMYMLNYNINEAITELLEKSKGIWWNLLDPDCLDINPRLEVHTDAIIDSKFDPSCFLHHDSNNAAKAMNKMFEIELEQNGSQENCDELGYIIGRVTKTRRPSVLLTGREHGLVSGLEEGLIIEHVLRPWILEEVYNCLALFLMLGMPRYWKNGASRILLIHDDEQKTLEQILINRG